MAAEETVVVVLEDVHWADDMLLDVVDQLLGQSRGRALMVVCTARPELADRRPSWGAGANMLSVTLERLDDSQTLSLLRHAGPALRPEQAERVAGVAEGNPLFAEHLAALIGDAQGIESLPPSIGLLLTARLEALPDPEREVLGVAAVAGRDFPAAAVAALVDRPVDAELDHVSRRELVEPIGGEDGMYRFAHALLQEAAYGLLPKARRADLHVALARWLDDDGAGDAVVGDHLDRAWRLRVELGMEDAPLAEEAGLRLAEAGRRADAMGEPPARARALLERALELLPDGSPGQAAATIELVAAGWNILPPRTPCGCSTTESGAHPRWACERSSYAAGSSSGSALVYDLVDVDDRLAEITAALSQSSSSWMTGAPLPRRCAPWGDRNRPGPGRRCTGPCPASGADPARDRPGHGMGGGVTRRVGGQVAASDGRGRGAAGRADGRARRPPDGASGAARGPGHARRPSR